MNPYIDAIFAAIGRNSPALISGLLGALIGGFLTGRYLLWQTREVARHNLRGIVVQMGVHAKQCKTGGLITSLTTKIGQNGRIEARELNSLASIKWMHKTKN